MATAPSRSHRPPPDLDALAPVVPWREARAYLKAEWKQGEHFAVLGPTGSGKTFAALEVAEIRTYVILVACKPKDPLIQDAIARGYWLVPTDRLEIPYSDGRPLHPRVIYWPRLSERQRRSLPDSQVLRAERSLQRPRVQASIGYVRNAGHWTLLLDETTWVCRDLRLQEDVDSALFSFRSLDSSIILLAQRPSWIGRFALSSPRFLILFQTNDDNDRKALGEISSVDTRQVREIVGELDFQRHECLLIDTYARRMVRTVVERER
jgi:hypothetical protein